MADSELSEAGFAGKSSSAKGRTERIELSKLEAAVARRVAESKATIPHAYAQRRVELPEPLPGAGPAALLLSALGRALASQRALNAAYRDGAIVRYSRVNLGFFVETSQGALVPTLFDADKMTMEQIAARIEDWERAPAGSLTAPELSGGTFAASFVPDGADAVTGIITPGQVGHLAIGRPRPAQVGVDESPRSATIAELTLSYDQRAVRPPQAAALLGALAGLVGDP